MNDAAPLFEVEMHTAIMVQSKGGLAIIEDNTINRIYDLKVAGDSIFTGAEKNQGLVHRVPMEAASLSLIHELLRDNNTDLKFISNYFYIHREQNHNNAKSINYMAIGPISAQVEGDAKHILPGRFMCMEHESPIKYFIEFDENNIPLLGKQIVVGGSKRERINKKLGEQEKRDNLLKLCKSGHVSVTNELMKFEKVHGGTINFVFRMKVKFHRYYWGEFIKILPMPEFPRAGSPPHHGLLLGIGDSWWVEPSSKKVTEPWVSPNLWEKVEELNPILLSGGKQTVLIVGEPGSGKEVFSNALHHGAVRKKAGDAGLKARAIANMTNENLADLLYGHMVDGTEIPGLIGEAEGGTLFLDEFDKVEEEGWYAELLRVLEAGEYVPVNGSQVKKVLDVSWIFAGAFTGNASSKILSSLPPDFWSRLTAQIRIVNPIRMFPQQYEGNKISYSGAVFAYFVLREAVKLAGGVSSLLYNEVFPADYANKLIIDPENSFGISCGFMDNVCLKFQREIGSGVYCRFDQKKPDEILALYWADIGGEASYVRPNISDKYKPDFAFDSVRSIIKAAQAAFIVMRDEAMRSSEFWESDGVPSSIYEKAIVQAAKIVRDARPGKQVREIEDGKWGIFEGESRVGWVE